MKNVIKAQATVVSKSVVGDLNPNITIRSEHTKNKNIVPIYDIIQGARFIKAVPVVSVTRFLSPPIAHSKKTCFLLVGTF